MKLKPLTEIKSKEQAILDILKRKMKGGIKE